ncbi:MAG TPA: hypothetical protein ENL21_03625 [Caldithrix abyssi]|uniref:Uncharacterized protein n=1 Tax=Caldithrix abyssi TaxID=187145 RepID=A0A7V5H385_CALAY|nr:hypothetical protein [Caldithrix abyssi]
MKINPKYLLFSSLALLLVALVLHVNIFFGLENIPYSIDLFLTAAMVIVWLVSSHLLKQLQKFQPSLTPLQVLRLNTPVWLPFFVVFTGLYAIFNMGMMIRTCWAGNNLRGISGFWIFFFALGLLISWAKMNQQKSAHTEENDE